MATDGHGVTSEDGKTVTYSASFSLTGIDFGLTCGECGENTLTARYGTVELAGRTSRAVATTCSTCTARKSAGHGVDQPTEAIDRALLVE